MAEATEPVVLDASVIVDVLADTANAAAVKARIRHTEAHAPAHVDAEVFSALGRMRRAGDLLASEVDAALDQLTAIPVTRHPVAELLTGAWARRGELRLVDALYVELASQLRTSLLTTDGRLARACPLADDVTGSTQPGPE